MGAAELSMGRRMVLQQLTSDSLDQWIFRSVDFSAFLSSSSCYLSETDLNTSLIDQLHSKFFLKSEKTNQTIWTKGDQRRILGFAGFNLEFKITMSPKAKAVLKALRWMF